MATWWRIVGKRLRSRSQFAPLLGHTPKAYALWIARFPQAVRDNAASAPPLIVALIDGTEGASRDATRRSLDRERISAIDISVGNRDALRAAARLIDWTKSPWLLPITAGDELAPGAAGHYAAAIEGYDGAIVYADDDLLTRKGRRKSPHFKPGWNGELFRYLDYLSGACIVRVSEDQLVQAGDGPDWTSRLIRAASTDVPPCHVPHVLHHRGERSQPPKMLTSTAGTKELPPVSVIIPTRDRADLLSACVAGLLATDYPDLEIIIVDNDSRQPEAVALLTNFGAQGHRVLQQAGPFNFSAMNNLAVAQAKGRLLCLLNNDIEIRDPDWLRIMAAQALRDDVGAVGAQLLYPDGLIQHAGVILGVGGGAAHAHRLLRPDEEGYFRRHALPQFVSAVTAACLVVQRDRYLAVGGLDERNFAVAFNDVDFCMRLNQRGWQSFYEPRARLIHHESLSRGHDQDPVGKRRFAGEFAALQRLWNTDRLTDPFHHVELSRFSEQFVVRL